LEAGGVETERTTTSTVVDDAIYATLCSHLTSGWTAFETLTADLWDAALNCHPSTLAGLKGNRNRISKIAGTRYNENQEIPEDERQTDFKLSAFERITKGTLNAQGSMGALLKPTCRFDKLNGIRQAYSAAFSKRHTEIDALLAHKSLDKLNLVRNVILHRGGKADDKFLAGVAAISWECGVQLDNLILLDGQIVRDLLSPVFITGWNLIYTVDEWISPLPMPTMRLDLALLFVFDFPLLNLCTRDRNETRCSVIELPGDVNDSSCHEKVDYSCFSALCSGNGAGFLREPSRR
jgi:hypothetical protein